MKTKVVALFLFFALFFSVPLLAEEQLMTKLFFDNWLKNSTTPLELSINQLQETYATMESELEKIRDAVTTEIKVIIGQNTAYVDGQAVSLDVAPLIINGRTLVPVRFIGEAFGAKFSWDEAARKVTYRYREIEIDIFVDKKAGNVNGKVFTMDTAPVIIEGRTLVPIRFVSEQLKALIEWDGKTQTVHIYG